jgi:UDP-N-acetylmuramoylalanine--D-glutamate ligase
MTMTPMDLTGRHVVVMGAGRSGLAASQLLASRGARVVLVDDRALDEDAVASLVALGVDVRAGGMTPEASVGAHLVVVSPGVPIDHPAVAAARDRGLPVIGELELAWRHLAGPVIAITGSKGKSTTTTLIGRMLEAGGRTVQVGGNIGVALSAQAASSTPDTWHVVETSSFQLETIEHFRPQIAVWLNFSPDHLDRHGTVEVYEAAKARVFENQTASDWAVVNADDPVVQQAAARGAARQRTFGAPATVRDGVTWTDRNVVLRHAAGAERPLVPLSGIALKGQHMLTNVLAACAVADLVGVPPDAMEAALAGFTGLEHALEPVGEVRGVQVFNDSKATNVDAALKGIEAFDARVVAIVGGVYKGGDFGLLAAPLAARGGAAVVIGEAADRIDEALQGRVPVARAASMDEAVTLALERARPGDVVVLAPACSSFDMFRDYADRGRAFKAAVARARAAATGGAGANEQ